MKRKQIFFLLIPLLLLLASVSLSLSSEKDTTKESDEKKGYIGAATCQGCHETQYESYKKSIHSKKQVKGPAYKEACETCHGPGAKHVEKGGGRGVDIFDFGKKVDGTARAARCLTCHEETRHLANWSLSKHSIAGVSCNDCHSVHSPRDKNLKIDQPDLCYGCHMNIRMQMNKQSHHPVKEGRISCSNCHDPHGTFGDHMIKADTVNELCYTCHAEKRGPFLWEHAPVEENCLNCHNSHGSNHNKLLVRKPPQLCQSCHAENGTGHASNMYTAFETFNGAATGSKNRMFTRGCVNCHTNIHGSNSPASGQRFVR